MNDGFRRDFAPAPHPAHIPHAAALFTDNTFLSEYAGLTSPALESGEWHMRPACASRARMESRAPVISERCDWNGNITSVQEVIPGGMNVTSTFVYDYENRLTEYAVGGTNFSVEHTYDGYNRLIKTDATIGANTQNFEHVYAGRQHLGNIETTGQPVNGKVWKWEAGAGMPNAGPIESPQRYTASATQFYMVSDERNVERKSYRVASITAGDYNDDSRYAEWQQVNGNAVPTRPALMAYKSELFNAYQVTLDADRASSAATNHALQLAASDLEYEGTRVKSPVLGRDLNPMGRGNGAYYANGGNDATRASISIQQARPFIVGEITRGFGNSVNNGKQGPDPACFSICICAPKCLLDWMNGGKKGYPDACCDDEEARAEAQRCCMKDSERQKAWKIDAFNKECLGCESGYNDEPDKPDKPEDKRCCEVTPGRRYRHYDGMCYCIAIGQNQVTPHISSPTTGVCRYRIDISEPIQNRVKCDDSNPKQVVYGEQIGWIDVTAMGIACSKGCSIGSSITIPGDPSDAPKVPPKNALGVGWAGSFNIPEYASFPAVCGDDYERQEYGFYLAPVGDLSDKPKLIENCGGGICQRSRQHPQGLL